MNFGFLKRNLGYKLLSLALAILVYAWVYAQNRPNVSREEYVQPEVQGLPKDMVLKAGAPGGKITVTGLATAVDEFHERQPKATIDLAGATPGANTVEIRYDTRGLNLDVVGPRRVTVIVDKKAERQLPVEVIPQNAPPAGLEYSTKADPPRVQISGLASEVSKVVKVVAIVPNTDANGTNGSFNGAVELIAQAANDAVIDSVTIAPARVTITLGLKQSKVAKALILSPTLVGAVAPGYALYGISFEPQTVTVSGGGRDVVEKNSLTVPVDISGLKESVTRRVKVAAPRNTRIEDPDDGNVTVRVDIRAIAIPNATPVAPPSAAAPVPKSP